MVNQWREAGRKGGQTTKAKYGADHYREIGKLGGRPPVKRISQLLAERQQVPAVPDNGKKGVWPPQSMQELRGLFFERQGNDKERR